MAAPAIPRSGENPIAAIGSVPALVTYGGWRLPGTKKPPRLVGGFSENLEFNAFSYESWFFWIWFFSSILDRSKISQ
jgi:hypothetical protein